jgi:hypothetical protein
MQRLPFEEGLSTHTRHQRVIRSVVPHDSTGKGVDVERYGRDLNRQDCQWTLEATVILLSPPRET